MFTLKFFKYTKDGEKHSEVVSATSYQKTVLGDAKYIFIINLHNEEKTVEFKVNNDHKKTGSFSHCYVENISGKTIDSAHSNGRAYELS